MFNEASDKLLRPGTVGVLPTDTVYGLIARATDEAAVTRLYRLKAREHKPGTIIAANIEQLENLGLKHRYLTAVQQFWPGPLSVIIPCANPELTYLHLDKQSLAVRLPADPGLEQLLLKTGPLLTSSANLPGQPTATTMEQARAYFNDSVDFYIDGGDLAGHQPSTIIRIIDDAIEVIREGAIKITD